MSSTASWTSPILGAVAAGMAISAFGVPTTPARAPELAVYGELPSTEAATQTSFRVLGAGSGAKAVLTVHSSVEAAETQVGSNRDALARRLAALRDLEDGWDGEGSLAPTAAAVEAVLQAATRLTQGERDQLDVAPHADGYLAVTLKTGAGHRFADVYSNFIEYEVHPSDESPHTGPLDAEALGTFLAA